MSNFEGESLFTYKENWDDDKKQRKTDLLKNLLKENS